MLLLAQMQRQNDAVVMAIGEKKIGHGVPALRVPAVDRRQNDRLRRGLKGGSSPPSLSTGYEFRKETFAGMGGKEEDAPTAAARLTTTSRLKSTQTRRSMARSCSLIADTGLAT